jgi:hypothetical protein
VRTYAHAVFEFNPPLSIKSVEKRCGKTRLCEVVDRVAAKPLLVSSVSPSALLRVIETDSPTVILDELDALLKKSPELAEALRGLLNSSFDRAIARHVMSVPIAGGGYEVRQFSMRAPLVLSGIGELPDTVRDRAIGIEMTRKRRDEKVDRLRQRDGQDLRELARKAARWVCDHMTDLGNARPELPGWLNDRAADAWEPLFAIADLAGESWRKRAEVAAAALSGDGTAEDGSFRVKLLADIYAVFAERKVDRLSSDDIAIYLAGLEGRPWGKARKPISKTQVADLLRPLYITPTTIDFGPDPHGKRKVAKGYYLSAFKDAFSRYLPPGTVSAVTPLQAQDSCGLEPDPEPLQEGRCNGLENPGNPSVSAICNDVSAQSIPLMDKHANGAHSGQSGPVTRGAKADPPDRPKRGRLIL